jgi:hypothetical protein
VKSLSAASEIDAWCTKCRMDLGHRIVAMVSGAPKRVVCLTCNSEHNYRPPRLAGAKEAAVQVRGGASAAKTRAPASTAGGRVAQKARGESQRYESWASKTLGKSVDAFTRYSMERSFREGELVIHPKFGEGFIQQVLEGGKVSVMFRDGAKVLAHLPPK